ncbi:SUMF1/EgtB/PvdO family nonheme iron enzyme [Pseudoalteromonas fenneropenaei]|uniref:SUMF1/EgtB/PvdO family nonheme iron enzyme n=1 Tax=Pseudoalteromonas fenneropenaei TaxID=1737459 RepID=A0ABV7CN62_9GAMM
MSSLDAQINADKKQRKTLVLITSIAMTVVMVGYLIWLFVMRGYVLNVAPQAAAATARIDVVSGLGFMLDNTLYTLPGDTTVLVSADKYIAAKVAIGVDSPANIEIVLQPKPAEVKITAAPALDDLMWTVNGQPGQVGAVFSQSLPPGEYQLQLSHPWFEPQSLTIQAEIAGKIEQTLTLTPIAGHMQITSTPVGASVVLNGEIKGVTPLGLPIAGGEYQLQILQTGYETSQDTIRISQSLREVTRHYQLLPEQAELKVDLTPSDGVLLLNGKPATAPVSVDANVKHLVRYERAGFIAQQQALTLSPGERKTLGFNLQAEYGEVQFNADKPAELWLDGKLAGTTPLKLKLQTLPTAVEFKKVGFRSVKKTVTANSKQMQTVNAELLTEFAARRKEGKPLFISQLGISMEKIQSAGASFTMGSPVNEAGRMRHEHQLGVKFSKPFWVSKHEITNAQFAAMQGAQASQAGNEPVTNISWLEAVQYCNWLSEQEGLAPFYQVRGSQVAINQSAAGYRLLTEAEWEFVAKQYRRSTATVYVWGSQERVKDKQGNFADASLKGKQTFVLDNYQDGFSGKAPVGSFKADRSNLFDLDGNVREWVYDFYTVAPPAAGEQLDYSGPSSSAGLDGSHVIKGASYKTGRLSQLRASVRDKGQNGEDDVGFRIARFDE